MAGKERGAVRVLLVKVGEQSYRLEPSGRLVCGYEKHHVCIDCRYHFIILVLCRLGGALSRSRLKTPSTYFDMPEKVPGSSVTATGTRFFRPLARVVSSWEPPAARAQFSFAGGRLAQQPWRRGAPDFSRAARPLVESSS